MIKPMIVNGFAVSGVHPRAWAISRVVIVHACLKASLRHGMEQLSVGAQEASDRVRIV
jgi:hypothetical protein